MCICKFIVAVIAFSATSLVRAQPPATSVFHVQDAASTPVPNVSVVVISGTVGSRSYTTDSNGDAVVAGAQGQAYDATLSASGFAVLHSVSSFVGGNAVTSFTLHIANASGYPLVVFEHPKWEYGVQVSGGVGLEDRTNFSFLNAGAHAGRVLTPNFGSGPLQLNFEYGVEVIPFWQSYTPKFQRLNCPAGATSASQCHGPTTTGGTYRGVSIVPIQLRFNFTHGERFTPWIQGAGGVLYTTRKYPAVGSLNVSDPTMTGPAADTSVWNFTPQFGVGAHYFLHPRRSLDFSANAVHISSASLGDKNPGVNTSVQFALGYSWWK